MAERILQNTSSGSRPGLSIRTKMNTSLASEHTATSFDEQILSRASTMFSSDDENDDDDDDGDLPFPQALPRSDFLAIDFDPSVYLSDVTPHRHQTLDDLKRDLRERSQLLSQELLDLVNSHHQDFLELGLGLKGGDEKVEELRVGLLGFEREVKDIRRRVVEHERGMSSMLEQRQQARGEVDLNLRLLQLDSKLQRLEEKLMVDEVAAPSRDVLAPDTDDFDDSSSDDDDSESDDGGASLSGGKGSSTVPLSRLQRRVDELLVLRLLATKIGIDHPFIINQRFRFTRIHDTILLDLGTALKAARSARSPHTMDILELYRDLDACGDAVKAAKAS